MPKPYSQDLRERVVGAVEAGASCHEAAATFEVGVSSAIRWMARLRATGSVRAKPMGGRRSPLDAQQGMVAGADCRRTGFDAAGNPRPTARARHCRRRQFSVAVLRSPRPHLLKNHLGLRPPVGVETVEVYPLGGRERPTAFWWQVTPQKNMVHGLLRVGCCARESGDAIRRSRLGN